LRFAYLHKDDQLTSIDHDDKVLSNWQSQVGSCKNEDLIIHDSSSVITHIAIDRLKANWSKSEYAAFELVTQTN
jgi:hypothetical protein